MQRPRRLGCNYLWGWLFDRGFPLFEPGNARNHGRFGGILQTIVSEVCPSAELFTADLAEFSLVLKRCFGCCLDKHLAAGAFLSQGIAACLRPVYSVQCNCTVTVLY